MIRLPSGYETQIQPDALPAHVVVPAGFAWHVPGDLDLSQTDVVIHGAVYLPLVPRAPEPYVLPAATTSTRGGVELATVEDTNAITNAVRAVTPFGLRDVVGRISSLEETAAQESLWTRTPQDGYTLNGTASSASAVSGPNSQAVGIGSTAFSGGVTAAGYAHADSGAAASGGYSHADSLGIATGSRSHADSGGNAQGFSAHANSGGITSPFGNYQFACTGGQASGAYSRAFGQGASARADGRAEAAGSFSEAGDAQHGCYVLKASTSNAIPTQLTLRGSWLMLMGHSAMAFRILVAATTASSGEVAGYEFSGLAKRTPSSVSIVGTVNKTVLAEEDSSWDCNVSAGSSSLIVTVTGKAGVSINWVATVWTTEVKR